MHPAFSVIFFTTLSGAGYGLWLWVAVMLLLNVGGRENSAHLFGLALGFVLVSAGLLSSLAHLGKPLRAWRAISQWRTSWLSREGVLALICYVPALLLAGLPLSGRSVPSSVELLLAFTLIFLAVATVACTAMIYASLKPVPAWRHRLVLPVYLGFALLSGGLLAAALLSWRQGELAGVIGGLLLLTALILAEMKRRYWRAIDQQALPALAGAVGLAPGHTVHAWEAPHTQANYLTREMGFVLARRHRLPLRRLALLLFAGLPTLLLLALHVSPPGMHAMIFVIASVSCLLGAVVERWLFFAEARHVVSVYYG